MTKTIKKIAATVIATAMVVGNMNVVKASTKEVFYSNDLGLALTNEEFVSAAQYMDLDELELFNQEEYDYFISHIDEDSVISDVKYVKTSVQENGKKEQIVNEEYISEGDMLNELNLKNKTMDSYYEKSQINTCGLADREDTVKTNMKKIEMRMYSVGASAKKVSLTCTWLSLPKTRSYDVIAFRTTAKTAILDSNGTENILGFQYYDGKQIKYTYTSDNLKKSYHGIGLSMNIVDSVSKSLSMKFSVTFGSNVDPYTVYGSYQHSVDDISLAKSKKYTISASGMGKVIKFNSSVASSYDDTPGLVVTGSLYDGL